MLKFTNSNLYISSKMYFNTVTPKCSLIISRCKLSQYHTQVAKTTIILKLESPSLEEVRKIQEEHSKYG